MRKRRGVLIIAGLLLAAALSGVSLLGALPALAESKSFQWQRLDSDITVEPNGDLSIVETNVVDFTEGTFTFGYRDIDQSRLTGITDIQATDNGQPLQVETSETEDGDLRITYYFLAPVENEQRTIVLSYRIQGATRYYPEGDEVYWAAVYADRNGFPVLESRATVRLPEGATATKAEAYGPKASVTGVGESVVVAEALEPIDSGQQFEIRVRFPHGIISGSPPPWQQAYDQLQAYQQTTKPIVDAAFLLLSLLVAGGVPALFVVAWYTRGRDPQVGLVAEYLAEPPSGVAPGIAGALVDERADIQDVIATLVDLARRGVLTMTEEQGPAFLIFAPQRDWSFSRGPNYGAALAPHEQLLVQAMELDHADQVALSGFKNKFYKKLPAIQSALYDQLVAVKYYARRPDTVRNLYTALGIGLFVLAGFGWFATVTFLADLASTAICLNIALGIAGLVALIAGRGMPVRTAAGAETKARLEAFKRYLQSIERYVDLKSAASQFDRYLPYAIAFGLDRSWIQKFSTVDTPAPAWYIPFSLADGAGGSGGRGSTGGTGSPGGAAQAPVSVSSLNAGVTAGLVGINTGLTAMFSSVTTTFSSSPSSSGGGGGGGGSSGGGGGGFG